MSQTIGIDLGTTNSCMCIMQADESVVLPNRESRQVTESIAYLDNGEFLIGRPAENIAKFDPGRVLYATKRLLGRNFNDHEVAMMREDREVSYSIVKAENDAAWVEAGGEQFNPTWVSAFILRKLKLDAEKALGREVTGAVVTVPAYFTDAQRRETMNAGRIAGFAIKRIIKEPSAAALAFVQARKIREVTGKIAVYDLGGGTFDISIIEVAAADSKTNLDVLTIDGDGALGGIDFDRKIRNYLRHVAVEKHGIDPRPDPIAWHRLEKRARTAKEYLSANNSCLIKVPADDKGNMIEHTLTREKLEGIVLGLVAQSIDICERALAKARIDKDELTDVFLVGGMTNMPFVRRKVQEFFGRAPRVDIPAQHAVAIGAALQAEMVDGGAGEMVLRDSAAHSLGIRTKDGDDEHRMAKVLKKDTPVPAANSGKFAPAESEQERAVIEVYQGEDASVRSNSKLGEMELAGLQDAKSTGEIEVAVTFKLNENDMVEVVARHVNTGREVSDRFRLVSGDLSGEQLGQVQERLQRFCGSRPGTVRDFAGSRDADPMPGLLAHEIRASSKRQKGDLDGAIADYGKAIEIDPSADNHAARASARRQKGDLDGAIADYDRVLEINPSADNYAIRASAKIQKGDFDGAIADYDQVIKISPSAHNHEIRAAAKIQKGDLDGALADYDKAIAIDPSAHNYKIRASAKRQKGDFDEAIADLDKVIEISPECPQLRDPRLGQEAEGRHGRRRGRLRQGPGAGFLEEVENISGLPPVSVGKTGWKGGRIYPAVCPSGNNSNPSKFCQYPDDANSQRQQPSAGKVACCCLVS